MKTTIQLLVRGAALLAIAFSGAKASADTLVSQGLDASNYGWYSTDGAQQIAEPFSTTVASDLTSISWFGAYESNSNMTGDFNVLFYNDIGNIPDAVAFATYTFTGLTGVDTGINTLTGYGNHWISWTASLPPTLLAGPANYWVSIRGQSGSGFLWSQAPSGGDGMVVARFSDSEAWSAIGWQGRDSQSLTIEANTGRSVPDASATLAMFGLGLAAMVYARTRRSA